jgi:voltage-gated potassium channel
LLVGGVILIGVVIAWQIRAILISPFPRLRGFQTLISGIPLLLVVFAAVYYLTGLAQPGSFTEPIDKTGAMYFTVTVFSTVGFGDITAKTDLARTLVTIQMLFNLVVLGLVAKVIFGAVDIGVKKRSAEHRERSEIKEQPEPSPAD